MTYINEKEEELIDNGKELNIERNGKTYKIKPNQIYCYGEIDFSDNSEDNQKINTFDCLNYLDGFTGISICSNYDYNNHICLSNIPEYQWTHTWNLSKLCQYAHGCLNKPKRVLMFKHIEKIQ